ncbi:MoaD/ThiS family protein [Desulfonatronum parangueonense]
MTGYNEQGAGQSGKAELTVRVRLESILAEHAPANPEAFPIPEGCTLAELIRGLGLREDQVMFAFVNGHMATLQTRLPDKASISLCPYICGG